MCACEGVCVHVRVCVCHCYVWVCATGACESVCARCGFICVVVCSLGVCACATCVLCLCHRVYVMHLQVKYVESSKFTKTVIGAVTITHTFMTYVPCSLVAL